MKDGFEKIELKKQRPPFRAAASTPVYLTLTTIYLRALLPALS